MTTENQAPEGGPGDDHLMNFLAPWVIADDPKDRADFLAALRAALAAQPQQAGPEAADSAAKSLSGNDSTMGLTGANKTQQATPSLAPAEGDELPPLPQAPVTYLGLGHTRRLGYTDEQMRAYARAARVHVQPKGTPAAVPMCSEQAVLHALTMARSETHQQGDAALWQAFGRAIWRQFNAMLPAVQAPAPGAELDEATAAGDGTLHGAIDYWQKRALAAEAKIPSEAEADAHETNQVLANNYLELTCGAAQAPAVKAANLERDYARALDAINGHVERIKVLEQQVRELQAFKDGVELHQRGGSNSWYWLDDRENYLETMVASLPVVIRAEQLRALLAPSTQQAPPGFVLVESPITEEMHQAACKVLTRASGLDGTPQRMLDALAASKPPVHSTGEQP